MAYNFPINPAIWQEHTTPEGTVYVYNGYGWGLKPHSGISEVIIADVAPPLEAPGRFWWESDSGMLWISYRDVSGDLMWVQASGSGTGSSSGGGGGGSGGDFFTTAESDTRFVNVAGDTMTGNLLIDKANLGVNGTVIIGPTAPANPVEIYLAGSNRNLIRGSVNGLERWVINLGDGSTESGSNNGSDFSIWRCTDTGAPVEAAFTLERHDGHANFMSTLTAVHNVALLPRVSGNSTNLTLDSRPGGAAAVSGYKNGVPRWSLILGDGAEAESTGNQGTDCIITRMSDEGTYIDTPFRISRDNGNMELNNAMSAKGYIVIQPKGGLCTLMLDAPAGSGGNINFSQAQASAFQIGTDQSGDYRATRYSAAGGLLGTALIHYRLTNKTEIFDQLVMPNGSYVKAGGGNSRMEVKHTNGNAGAYIMHYDDYPGARFGYGPSNGIEFNLAVNGDISALNAAFKPGGGPWGDSSDARIKTVHGDYDGGLAQVLQLQPKRFSYNGLDTFQPLAEEKHSGRPAKHSPHFHVRDKEFVGFVAQEVETVMPEMVSQRKGFIDGDEVNDLRVLDTNALIYALVNSVKTLTARIADLEARLPPATKD